MDASWIQMLVLFVQVDVGCVYHAAHIHAYGDEVFDDRLATILDEGSVVWDLVEAIARVGHLMLSSIFGHLRCLIIHQVIQLTWQMTRIVSC